MLNVFANAMLVATRSHLEGSGAVRDKWLSPAVRRQQSRRAVAAAMGPVSDRPAPNRPATNRAVA